MAGPTTRTPRPGDVDAITAVHVRAWRAAYAELVPPGALDGLDVEARREQWRRTLATPAPDGVHRFVTTDGDDRVVAFAVCGPAIEPPPGVTGQLYVCNADPAVWGRGHGSALLAAAEHALAADGHERAMLWVAVGNDRATGVYEHRGWRADGATKREELEGVPFHEQRMVLALDAG